VVLERREQSVQIAEGDALFGAGAGGSHIGILSVVAISDFAQLDALAAELQEFSGG
jgi:hypothetical protein